MARPLALAVNRQTDARTRLLDAGERLFAEESYHAVSLRAIMAEAQVNISAAHYYFGSKDNLLRAVFERRAAKINQARKERLLACEGKTGKPASVEAILEAYMGPALEVCSERGGQLFVRVAALASVDPSPEVQKIVQSIYDETAMLFVGALKRACPGLKEPDLYWRLNCVYGAMMYLRANNGRVARVLDIDEGPIDSRTVQEALRHVVPFLAAGFSLPPR